MKKNFQYKVRKVRGRFSEKARFLIDSYVLKRRGRLWVKIPPLIARKAGIKIGSAVIVTVGKSRASITISRKRMRKRSGIKCGLSARF